MIAIIAIIAAIVLPSTAPFLSTRPNRRTSARERLIRRNPTLGNDESLRWSTAARRVRFGWLTALVISAAVLIATSRVRTVSDR